jgi:hypothetical protein
MNRERVTQAVNMIKDFIAQSSDVPWQEEYISLVLYPGGIEGDDCYGIKVPRGESYNFWVTSLQVYAKEKGIEIEP